MFSPFGGDVAGREKEESGKCSGYAHNCVSLNFPEQWLLAMPDFNLVRGLIRFSEKIAGFGSN